LKSLATLKINPFYGKGGHLIPDEHLSSFVEHMKFSTNLKALHFGNGHVSSNGLVSLSQLPKLEILQVYLWGMTAETMTNITLLSNLKELHLCQKRKLDEIFTLRALPDVPVPTKNIYDSFHVFSSLTNLESLRFYGNLQISKLYVPVSLKQFVMDWPSRYGWYSFVINNWKMANLELITLDGELCWRERRRLCDFMEEVVSN